MATHIPSGNSVMQILRQGEKEMCVTEAQDTGGAGMARHGVRDSDTCHCDTIALPPAKLVSPLFREPQQSDRRGHVK